MGQSFTPSLDAVGFTQFYFIDPTSGDGLGGTVYVNLRSDSITGPILGSTPAVVMPDYFVGSTNFFFMMPVAVTPGTNYFFELVGLPSPISATGGGEGLGQLILPGF